MSNSASHIPRTELDVPGFPRLKLTVYGHAKAATYSAGMEQGYFVAVDGKPTARAELPENQRLAVRALLEEKFPEHAAL